MNISLHRFAYGFHRRYTIAVNICWSTPLKIWLYDFKLDKYICLNPPKRPAHHLQVPFPGPKYPTSGKLSQLTPSQSAVF